MPASSPAATEGLTGAIPTGKSPSRWFAEEVQPHEPLLRNYLKGKFPVMRDVDDVVQESYLRIWKARAIQRVDSAKAFLFRVASNLAIDWIRRERIAPMRPVMGNALPDVIEDRPGVVEIVCSRDEVELFAQAIDTLPARCREIVILRKLRGLSHQAIAQKLGLSVNTIEVQLVRGMKRCDDYLRERGVVRPS